MRNQTQESSIEYNKSFSRRILIMNCIWLLLSLYFCGQSNCSNGCNRRKGNGCNTGRNANTQNRIPCTGGNSSSNGSTSTCKRTQSGANNTSCSTGLNTGSSCQNSPLMPPPPPCSNASVQTGSCGCNDRNSQGSYNASEPVIIPRYPNISHVDTSCSCQ